MKTNRRVEKGKVSIHLSFRGQPPSSAGGTCAVNYLHHGFLKLTDWGVHNLCAPPVAFSHILTCVNLLYGF